MKKFLHTCSWKIVGTVLAFLVVCYLALVHWVVPKYITQILPVAEETAKDYINGSVQIGGLTWNGGLTAEINNVVVKDLNQQDVAVLPKTRISLRPWLALQKPARALSKVEILEPQVWLRLDNQDKWNLSKLMKESESSETPFYGTLTIAQGKLNVVTPYGSWDFGVDANVNGGANPKFAVDAELTTATEQLNVSGLMTTKGEGKMQVNTEKIAFASYAPLVKHYTNVQDFAGDLLHTHVVWENEGQGNLVSGETEFANLGGKITVAGEEHQLAVGGKVKANKSVITLERVDAVVDKEQELHLTGLADVHDLDNVGGHGLLTSPKLTYLNYSVENLYVPFTVTKKLVQIDKAFLNFGGGEVKGSATVELEEKVATADFDVNGVSHALSLKPNDIVHANGKIAVLARQEAKAGKKTYQVHAAADTLNLAWQDVTINKLAFDGDFDGRKLTVDHFSAQTGAGYMALKGNVVPEKNGALDLQGRIADFEIAPVLYHFGNIQGKGKVSLGFKVKGTTSSPEFGTMVQIREVNVLNNVLREMHGFVGMRDKILTIKNMGATQTQGRHTLNGTVNLQQEQPVLNLDVVSKHVRIEPLVALATKEFSLTGNLDNTMHISGTPQHPRVEGELNMTDGSVQTYLVNGLSGKYLYDDGFISLQNVILKMFIAQLEFSGTVGRDKALNFELAAHNINVAKSPYLSKDITVEGLINLDGHVGGFVNAPYFSGKMASEKLKLNGETYADIAGAVESNMQATNRFDISFKQPHQNIKGESMPGEGVFKAVGNLNLTEKFLDGKVTIADGDISGLLRTGKVDYALDGTVNGVIDICPQGKGSGIIFNLDSNNLKTHDLQYDKLLAKGTFNNYILNLDEVLLQEKSSVSDKGYIKAYGVVDTVKKTLDLHARAVEANPAVVNVAMKDPLNIKGLLNLEADVGGSFDSPTGKFTGEIVQGSLMNIVFDKASATITLANDNIYVQKLEGKHDVYGISGSGVVPMDAIRAKEQRKNPDAVMNLKLNLDNTSLGILAASKYFDWGIGDIDGQVNITGTLDTPLVYGNVAIKDGTVKVRNLNPVLEHVNLSAEFTGDKATLNNFSTQIGKKGSITANGYYLLNAATTDAYKFNIAVKNAELSYASMFKGKINSELTITPQNYRDYWHMVRPNMQAEKNKAKQEGKATPQTAKAPIALGPKMLTEQIRPLIKGYVRLDDVVANILSLGDDEVGAETNIGLDMKVELGPKIHMLNAMFYDIWLQGGLTLQGGYYSQTTTNTEEDDRVMKFHNRGPDGLKIDGNISAKKGDITYLRTTFTITEALLSWTEKGEIMPYVKLHSWTRYGKYRVYLNIDGSLSDIKNQSILKLTSSPSVPQNTLIRMLTLQRDDTSGGNSVTGDDLNNVMTAGLEMAVLGNVELWVKQTLGLDKFRVYSGKVNTGLAFDSSDRKNQLTNTDKTRYNILISKYLSSKLMAGYTSDFNADERVLFGQYDLGRHFNLTYSEKQKQDGEHRNFYGLEYMIDFN